MIIDAHQHFWQYLPHRDTWITDQMEVLRRDWLPPDLAPILSSEQVDGCVAVQADQSVDETYFLLDCAENYSFVKGVVGWIDLRAENITEQLENFRAFPKLKGFRHIVQAEADENFLIHPDFQRGMAALEEANYSYDLLIYPNQLPAALRFAHLCSTQPIVLDHLAKPYIRQGLIDKWKTDLEALAACENVFCKVSGLITEAHWQQWNDEQLKPYLDVAFEAFGTQRLMFGSDWPVCLLAGQYGEVKSLLDRYLASFSASEKAQVMGGNARVFYKL
jgi:L-fuconolactonase